MKIRQLESYDLDKVRELHKRLGFDYKFPNFNEFFPIPTVVDSHDQPIMVVASMPTVELFLFGDLEWETPGMRMEAFKLIHEFVKIDLRSRGIVEVNAWLPPEMVKSFGRRLSKLGWDCNRPGWACFSRRTDHV